MALAEYLAKNYLNADPKPEKKSKKRKRKAAQDGLIIADDDAMDWGASTVAKDEDDAPLTVNHRSAEFRKAKSNNWQTLSGAPAPRPSSTDDAAADFILASAAAESSARTADDEDAPAIDDDSALRMENGARAGLTTARELAAQLAKVQAAEKARLTEGGEEAMGKGQETIYRDASGRIINIGMKRAEARKKVEEEVRKKAEEEEDAKGDVQRAEREKRKEEIRDAKFKGVARYADDKELNEELKEQERWNDPAAQFLTKKKKGKSVTGRPLYQGAAPPNRYGIRPGHKWDGVDRGGGFESEWFKARNRQKSLKDLDYAWQMDE